MGTVPNRYPVYMSEINAALGRGTNLGAYRGYQGWKGTVAYTVSQSPSMAEFPNLSDQNPTPYAGTLFSRGLSGERHGFLTGDGGDIQPRAVLGTSFYSYYEGKNVLLNRKYFQMQLYGIIPNAGFSRIHMPNIIIWERANLSFSQDTTAGLTTWSTQPADWVWPASANLEVRLENV